MIDQPPASWKRALLNCFIAIHLVALFLWGLPDTRFATRLLTPIASYMKFTGLWHVWNMFGPDICSVQMDFQATVEYQDGSMRQWISPRMQELSVWERVPKERFRKWREMHYHESFAPSYPASARFVARRMNVNATNPPVQVSLVRCWDPTVSVIRGQDYQPRPERYAYTNSFRFFEYRIGVADL